MSLCRCCGSLPHPFRRYPSSAIARTFGSSSSLFVDRKPPPPTNWGAAKQIDKSSALGKWAKQEPSSSGSRSDDRNRGQRSGGGGSFDRSTGRRDGGFGNRNGGGSGDFGRSSGGNSRQGSFGGDRQEVNTSKWVRQDDRRDNSRRGGGREDGPPKASGFGLRTAKSRSNQTTLGSIANTPEPSGDRSEKRSQGASRSDAFTSTRDDAAPLNIEADEFGYGEGRSDSDSSRGNRRSARHVSVSETEEGLAFVRGRQRKPEEDKGKEKHRAEYDVHGGSSGEVKQRRKKENRVEKPKEEIKVLIPSSITVSRLASIFGMKLARVQNKMDRMGIDKNKQRPDYMLNEEEACDVALEFGFNPTVDDEAAFDLYPEPEAEGSNPPLRPPVVTIMGHVDHGKTTLLDALRNTAVAAGEAGGITQHIGAFSVPLSSLTSGSSSTDATITFLDTPGHAAFTGMRARGASVTDIVVLVVAADDGVMPQTKEVIELVKAEGDNVGLVVAINKVDKPGIDIERVRTELIAENVYLEEDGGDIQAVRVSGLSRIGLDDLVETLSTLAELRDLRARTDGKAEGVVLESNIDRGAGRIATVLITRGTLKVGAAVVAGNTMCKVRRMTDHKGTAIKSAGPGTPVVVTGWRDIPSAGDELLEAPNGESEAKKVVANRLAQTERKKLIADMEAINTKRQEEKDKLEAEQEIARELKQSGENVFEAKIAANRRAAYEASKNAFKELRLVIKGDVSGTVEAVEGSLSGIGNKEAGVKIISTGVGEVTESDIALAEASEALVIGFNVQASRAVQQSAASAKVELHLESVIYRLIETVREKTAALLPPEIASRTIGEGTVIKNFTIGTGKRGQGYSIAGSRCTNGTINRNDKIKILRGPNREVVYEGTIVTLKHLKTEVDEVRKGMECGIQMDGFEGAQEGDEIVTFKTYEVARKL